MQFKNPADEFLAPEDLRRAHWVFKTPRLGSTQTGAWKQTLQDTLQFEKFLVLAVGATGTTLRELDDEAMQSSFVVAESRSCAERESGDVILSGAKVQAEMGEILSGSVAAPTSGRIVFKSVGMAIEDLTGAALVWQMHEPHR